MLLNRVSAEAIADGRVDLVLRRWDVARVKAGGTQRTAAGTIRIDDVAEYPHDYRVTSQQAQAAGYPDAAAAQAELDRQSANHTYLITVSFAGADERPSLAAGQHLDVPRFKRRVRRLKELGLTISLDVGYRLSPRGRAILNANR